jgi:hypothetical protein
MIAPTTTTTAIAGESGATSDTDASPSYCQRLNDGERVTNDSSSSTTPCVPDPSYVTGDEQADGHRGNRQHRLEWFTRSNSRQLSRRVRPERRWRFVRMLCPVTTRGSA